nr:hypothetical protein [Tanacetum cinerariifolium]
MHASVEWKLYDTCGVHHVTSKDKEIFMLVEKDYPLRKGLAIGMISYKLQGRIVENKMHKAFPLPVIEFPLLEEVPTANEESFHCQKKREATAIKIALLLKSRRNCQSKSNDSYTKIYNCQLDEQWLTLYKDILRDALQITPINDNDPFVAPPSSDAIIEYVNTLGYPVMLKNVSAMSVNDLHQPWRAILSMINLCITEFVQSTQTFLTDKKRLTMALHEKKNSTPLLISSIRFTKLIIHHLKTKNNIHPRTGSPLHYSHEDNVLSNLRFVGKDGMEVFGIPIHDTLLTNAILGAPYYGGYLAYVTEYQQYLDGKHGMAAEEAGLARLVIFKEPDSRRFQPLLEVQGKGKEKVIKEQAARDLLTLQTPKKKSPIDQYIFQRHSPTTTGPSGNAESPSLDDDLVDSETNSNKTVTPVNKEKDASNRELIEINAGGQDEGHTGSNPSKQDEGQAGSNPGNAIELQP